MNGCAAYSREPHAVGVMLFERENLTSFRWWDSYPFVSDFIKLYGS